MMYILFGHWHRQLAVSSTQGVQLLFKPSALNNTRKLLARIHSAHNIISYKIASWVTNQQEERCTKNIVITPVATNYLFIRRLL